jgi:hypothetical protein
MFLTVRKSITFNRSTLLHGGKWEIVRLRKHSRSSWLHISTIAKNYCFTFDTSACLKFLLEPRTYKLSMRIFLNVFSETWWKKRLVRPTCKFAFSPGFQISAVPINNKLKQSAVYKLSCLSHHCWPSYCTKNHNTVHVWVQFISYLIRHKAKCPTEFLETKYHSCDIHRDKRKFNWCRN